MSVTRAVMDAPAPVVFAALVDPWTYPEWLVGAKEIRSVDDAWPRPNSRFHHRVGLGGPATVADSTKILAIEPPIRLQLEVRARPFGRGRATFRLRPLPDDRTEVCLDERPVGVLAPLELLVAIPTRRRNARSLAALNEFLLAGQADRPPD